jgi:hypothetical protein
VWRYALIPNELKPNAWEALVDEALLIWEELGSDIVNKLAVC